jgi:hypothetical protein
VVKIGIVNGKPYLNIDVWVELPRSGYKNAAGLKLMTPLEKRSITEPIFRSFLSSFKFY